MYQQTDRFLKKLKERIRREFNHLDLLPFDELNVLRVREETTATFNRLIEFNEKEYKRIVSSARAYALGFLPVVLRRRVAKETESEEWTEKQVLATLLAYNFVTGYLYHKEAERKRLRLSEEMMTARQFESRDKYHKEIRTGANLWFTQSGQYAIDIEDDACIAIWTLGGIEKVRWVAEKDDRVCKTCRDRDGRIYAIDHLPEKPHYHCRCHFEPVL